MDCFLDTSILVRPAQTSDPKNGLTQTFIDSIRANGHHLFITAQNIVEFRSVATRPVGVNGLGWNIEMAQIESERFERLFQILPEIPDVFPEWKRVVSDFHVIGLQVHDARLFAVCLVYEMDAIVTFNAAHFKRFQTIHPNFKVVDPTNSQNILE